MSNQKKYEKFNINGIDSFEQYVSDMEKAEEQQIHVRNTTPINQNLEYQELAEEEEGFWETKNKAIVNSRTREVAQIVSDSYKILSHKDFFPVVVDNLHSMGITDITGYLLKADGGNSYTARLIFNSVEIEEPGMKGMNIKVGGEFSNSYDSSYAARGRGFYLRVSCTNQMLFGNIIPDCVFSRSHIAVTPAALLESVTEKTEDFMRALEVSGAQFSEVMNDAIDDEIIFDSTFQLEETVKSIFETKKHVDAITEMAEKKTVQKGDKLQLNRWDFYNVVTDYASHSAMTPNIFDQILIRAEKDILNKSVTPAKIAIQARV